MQKINEREREFSVEEANIGNEIISQWPGFEISKTGSSPE